MESHSGQRFKVVLCQVQYKSMSRIELVYKPVLAARPT